MTDIVPYQNDHVTSHMLTLMDKQMINPNVYAELERMFRVGDKVLRLRLDGVGDLKDKNIVKGLHSVFAGVYSLTQNEALDLFAFLYSKLHMGEYYECLVHNAYTGHMENLGFSFILYQGDQHTMRDTPYCSMERMYHAFLHSRKNAFKSEFFSPYLGRSNRGFTAPLETLLKLHKTNIDINMCDVRRHLDKGHDMRGWYPLKMKRHLGPDRNTTYIEGNHNYGLELKQDVPLEDLVMICDTLFEGLSAIQMPKPQPEFYKQIGEAEAFFYEQDITAHLSEVDKAFSAFELENTASFTDVKKRFTKMAVDYIPDKHPDEESKLWNDKLKEIIAMYKLLKNHFDNMEESSQDSA